MVILVGNSQKIPTQMKASYTIPCLATSTMDMIKCLIKELPNFFIGPLRLDDHGTKISFLCARDHPVTYQQFKNSQVSIMIAFSFPPAPNFTFCCNLVQLMHLKPNPCTWELWPESQHNYNFLESSLYQGVSYFLAC